MGSMGDLTEKDRFLIENAAVGYQKAKDLLAWWKAKETGGALKKSKLSPADRPEVHIEYFYDALDLEGKQVSAMGCFWKSRFPRKPGSPAPSDSALQTFIQEQFMLRCQWTNPDQLPRGFTFVPLQYKLQGR